MRKRLHFPCCGHCSKSKGCIPLGSVVSEDQRAFELSDSTSEHGEIDRPARRHARKHLSEKLAVSGRRVQALQYGLPNRIVARAARVRRRDGRPLVVVELVELRRDGTLAAGEAVPLRSMR
jgi:hypothetical protein